MTAAPPDSTLAAIQKKVRRLTVSPSESALSTDNLNQAINTFYQNDFPYAIKIDQMKSVYSFFTVPNVDRYPVNVNFNQGLRAPVYFEGIQGFYYKERREFFSIWPRFPTQSIAFIGDGVTQDIPVFTVATTPFLSQNVVIGGTDTDGDPIVVTDNGNGLMFYVYPNPQVSNPAFTANLSGMFNLNNLAGPGELGPGDYNKVQIGTVNYVTGEIDLDFTPANVTPADGVNFILFVSQYNVGRPYSLLFWNNEFTVRPVPDKTYKVEIETYMTPVQFLETTDNPILFQWWQYISYGTAMEILRERQDYEGVENLREGFMRQEAMVLERQGIEEIGQRNSTIFSGSTPNQGWNQGWGWPY